MIDLTDAVAAAVFANLSSAVTLAPVFSIPPEGRQPPYVVIGDDTVDPTVGGKDGGLERHEVRILTVIAGDSKKALSAAMRQVRDGLDGQPLAFVGAELSDPVILSSDDRVDGQNGVVIGEQTFLIFAQAED